MNSVRIASVSSSPVEPSFSMRPDGGSPKPRHVRDCRQQFDSIQGKLVKGVGPAGPPAAYQFRTSAKTADNICARRSRSQPWRSGRRNTRAFTIFVGVGQADLSHTGVTKSAVYAKPLRLPRARIPSRWRAELPDCYRAPGRPIEGGDCLFECGLVQFVTAVGEMH